MRIGSVNDGNEYVKKERLAREKIANETRKKMIASRFGPESKKIDGAKKKTLDVVLIACRVTLIYRVIMRGIRMDLQFAFP